MKCKGFYLNLNCCSPSSDVCEAKMEGDKKMRNSFKMVCLCMCQLELDRCH